MSGSPALADLGSIGVLCVSIHGMDADAMLTRSGSLPDHGAMPIRFIALHCSKSACILPAQLPDARAPRQTITGW